MKKAIAYVSDIILGRTGDVIARESQKELIRKYAADNDIEVVAWFEDEMYSEEVVCRHGVKEMLDYESDYDMILVERVWSFSRLWASLERLYEILERRNIKLQATTTMWDCVSQMSRRRFDKNIPTVSLRKEKEVVVCQNAATVRISRPKRLNFTFQPQLASLK